MNPKSFYTFEELQRRPTERLVRIYERIFNIDIAEHFFNPYESRMEIILAIVENGEAVQILMSLPQDEPRSHKPYKAVQITFSPDGISIIWTADKISTKKNGRKITDAQIRLMKSLRADGEKYQWIADQFGISDRMVSLICNGKRFANG